MKELNEDNLDAETQSGLVVIDFYAQWCGPCRSLAPILEQLQNIKVVKSDVDVMPDLASHFKIQCLPTLVFMKDGVELEKVSGLRSLVELQAKVDSYHVQAQHE